LFFHSPGDGHYGSHGKSAGDADYSAEVFYMRWITQRADEIGDSIAAFQGGQSLRCCAHLHEDNADAAFASVPIGNGKRDTLALFVNSDYHELTGAGLFGNLRGRYLEKMCFGYQVLAL
jgi:hypothetical protein